METTRKQRVSGKVAKKKSPEMEKSVSRNGDLKKVTPIILKKEELAIAIYDLYKNEINPLKKVRKGAIKNILFYLKEYPPEDLKKSILNYKPEALSSQPRYRKSCSNFFGRNGESERYFEDYLSGNFEQPKSSAPTSKEITAENVKELYANP